MADQFQLINTKQYTDKEQDDIKKFNTWVKEAQWASAEWRAESWRDCEMYDGGNAQWTDADRQLAQDSGIDILTINRTFPTVNYLLGFEAINKFDVITKARTEEDAATEQVMSKGLKFVLDQNEGEFLISQAFKDQIIPGFGCLSPCLNEDPRKEKLAIRQRDWKEVWWDPFASPWLNPAMCRYVFIQRWMDLDDLVARFYEKKNEIIDKYDELSGSSKEDYGSYFDDEATLVEEEKRLLSSIDWADGYRKRVRPVEMWYTKSTPAFFAVFSDGDATELTKEQSPLEQFEIIRACEQVVAAVVRKMHVCAFLDDLKLISSVSPYPHDQFPFVPFISYLDRWQFPYGVPRQIRGQDEEINKRRSMALAFLKSRRVIAEKSAAADDEERQAQYEEAQKLDGYIIVEDGAISGKKFIIVDEANLAPSQIAILQQDEREIQEVSGQNQETMGYQSNATSGKAIERRQMGGATVIAPIFNNLRFSLKLLGEQVKANMQGFWRKEKVLRITDSLTGAERFEILNHKIISPDGKFVKIKNNITRGRYDVIVTEAPHSDTIREKNIDLIMESVKRATPEVIPHLLLTAFELSSLPNKEILMAKIKPLLGSDPRDDKLSPEELKQKVIMELEAQRQQQQELIEVQKADMQLELLKKQVEIEKAKAEIQRLQAEAIKRLADVNLNRDRVSIEQQKANNETAGTLTEIAEAAHNISQPVVKAPDKK